MVGSSSYLENGTGLYSANLTFSLRVFIVKMVVGRKADYVKTTTVFTNLGECSYKFPREKNYFLGRSGGRVARTGCSRGRERMIPRSSLGGSRLRVAWISHGVIIQLRVLSLKNVSWNLKAVGGALSTQISLKSKQLRFLIMTQFLDTSKKHSFCHHLYWCKARVLIVDGVWVLYFQIREGRLPHLKRTLGWPQSFLPGQARWSRWPPIEVSWLWSTRLVNPVDNLTGKSP